MIEGGHSGASYLQPKNPATQVEAFEAVAPADVTDLGLFPAAFPPEAGTFAGGVRLRRGNVAGQNQWYHFGVGAPPIFRT